MKNKRITYMNQIIEDKNQSDSLLKRATKEIPIKDMRLNYNKFGVVIAFFDKHGQYVDSVELVKEENVVKAHMIIGRIYDQVLFQYASVINKKYTRPHYEVIKDFGSKFRFYEDGLVDLISLLGAIIGNRGKFKPANFTINNIELKKNPILGFLYHLKISTKGDKIIERDIVSDDAKTLRYVWSKIKEKRYVLFELRCADIVNLNSYEVLEVLKDLPNQHNENYFEFLRGIIPDFQHLMICEEDLNRINL